VPRDLALIVNPGSGRGKAGRLIEPVRERLRAGGVETEVLISRSPEHATELARAAAARHETVVAVGGDGMVSFVANGVLGTGAALGIVPTGTGNDFAVGVGYARRRPLEACAILAAGAVRVVDVGRIEGGRAFLCVASGGFDSEVNREANGIRWARGTAVYVIAVFKTLGRFRPAHFRVTLDGESREFDGMFVAVGNARSYGGGMQITPGAVLDDGLFDVCMVHAIGRPTLLAQFPRLFRGTHIRHPAIEMRRAREVRLEADREFFLYADGEEVGPLPAKLIVEERALTVIAPSPARPG
jgi:diacylglycerol kinase (ATP)